MALEERPNRVPCEVSARGAFIDADVEQAVAEVGAFEYLQSDGVSRYVADEDEALAVEDFLAIDPDLHRSELVFREASPYRPEIIEVSDVPGAPAVDAIDDLAVESEAGYRSEASIVYPAQVQGPGIFRLECPNQRLQFLVEAEFACEQVLGPVRDHHQRLVGSIESVGDFPDGAVAADGDNQRAVISTRCACR